MMTRKQERSMWTEINIALGKNEYYMPSSLGSRSISVGRQSGRQAGSEMFRSHSFTLSIPTIRY